MTAVIMLQKWYHTCVFLIICRKITTFSLKSFEKRNLFHLFLLYLHHKNTTNMEVKKLNRLKVVMAEKDLSNIWLSEKLGVSQATVSKWMTNFSQPNLETLIKISKVLNVEVSELIRTEEVQIEA